MTQDRIQSVRTAPRAKTFDLFVDGANVGRFQKDDLPEAIRHYREKLAQEDASAVPTFIPGE